VSVAKKRILERETAIQPWHRSLDPKRGSICS
jgi:hypothetical protein